jgi:hypothetical protein
MVLYLAPQRCGLFALILALALTWAGPARGQGPVAEEAVLEGVPAALATLPALLAVRVGVPSSLLNTQAFQTQQQSTLPAQAPPLQQTTPPQQQIPGGPSNGPLPKEAPEPATLVSALLGAGVAGLARVRRRGRR